MLSENQKLESKTEQLSIINQFSSSLLHLTKLDELFEYVTTQVVNRLGFVDCVIYLADPYQEYLEVAASMGVSHANGDYRVEQTKIKIGLGITGQVATTRAPLFLETSPLTLCTLLTYDPPCQSFVYHLSMTVI